MHELSVFDLKNRAAIMKLMAVNEELKYATGKFLLGAFLRGFEPNKCRDIVLESSSFQRGENFVALALTSKLLSSGGLHATTLCF